MSADVKIVLPSQTVVARPCTDVLGMVVSMVGTLAEERAEGGVLQLTELRRILEMIRGGSSPLNQVLEGQESKCRRAFRPSVRNASSRNDVFRRLLVRPFETLLEGEQPAFPRCFLANYFELAEAAFGDKLKHYDQRSKEIFQDMLVVHGNDLAWDVFFNDPRARAVLAHALHRIIHYVESPAGQWAWLNCMNRQNADGARPSPEQAELILAALRTTAKALGPIHEKKA